MEFLEVAVSTAFQNKYKAIKTEIDVPYNFIKEQGCGNRKHVRNQ